jgi:hypothetical protein
MSRVDKIVKAIIEEAKKVKHNDEVGRLYNITMEVTSLVCKEMERIRKKERKEVNDGKA